MANKVNLDILTNAKQVVGELRSMNAYLHNIQNEIDRMNARSTTGFNQQSSAVRGLALRFVGYNLILNQVMGAQRKLYEYVTEGVTKFREFQTRIAEVATIMSGDFQSALKGMETGIVNLSLAYGKGTSDLTKGLYDIMSAAFSAKEAMSLLNTATKASIAGLSDTRTSVDIFTTVLNSYGMSAYEATKVSDTLFQSVVRGKFQFEQLEQALGYVVPIAAQAGVQFEELMAALSTTTRHGLHLDMASRGLALAMQNIINPSEGASKAAEKYGVELSGLALRIHGLAGVFSQLNEKTKQYGKVILNELIPNMRSLRVAMVLAGDEGLEGLLDDMDRLSVSAGRTEEALNKIANTSEFASNQITQQWEKTQREVGAAWDKMALGIQGTLTKVMPVLLDPLTYLPIVNVLNAVTKGFDELGKKKMATAVYSKYTGFEPVKNWQAAEAMGGAIWKSTRPAFESEADVRNYQLKQYLALQEEINQTSREYADAVAKGSGNLEDIEAYLQALVNTSAVLQDDFNEIFGEAILGGMRNLEDMKLTLEEIGFDIERLKGELESPMKYGWGDYVDTIKGSLNYDMAVLKADQALADVKYDVKMGTEDETYSFKVLNSEMQEAVRIVREHEDAQKKDAIATNIMSAEMRRLQIAMLELQLIGMSRRRGLTRSEEKMMKKLQIEQAKLRLQNMKDTKIESETDISLYEEKKRMIEDYIRDKEHETYMLKYDYDQQISDLQATIDSEKSILADRYASWLDYNRQIGESAENLSEQLKSIMTDPELVEALSLQGWDVKEMLAAVTPSTRTAEQQAIDSAIDLLSGFGGGKVRHPGLDILERMRGYQRGTEYVAETGLAMVHAGETIGAAGKHGSSDGMVIQNLTISVREIAEIGSVEKLGAMLSSARNSGIISKEGKTNFRLRIG